MTICKENEFYTCQFAITLHKKTIFLLQSVIYTIICE